MSATIASTGISNRPRQQGRDHLGRRARRPRQAGRRTHPHLPPAASRSRAVSPTCSSATALKWRPHHHLHADGSRGRHRHARLRPHRRRALGRLRRLQRPVPHRPHPRLAARKWSSPPTAAFVAAPSCRSSRTWTKRSRSKMPRANGWPVHREGHRASPRQ